MKTVLICGVSGQDGAYLAKLLLEKGYRVVGTSRDAQVKNFANLDRLSITDRVERESMVLTDFRSTLQTIAKVKPDAAQPTPSPRRRHIGQLSIIVMPMGYLLLMEFCSTMNLRSVGSAS